MQDKPEDYYQMLYENQMCSQLFELYICWAYVFEQRNDYVKADQVYQLGIRAKADPIDRLKEAHQDFGSAMSQGLLYGTDSEQVKQTKERKRVQIVAIKSLGNTKPSDTSSLSQQPNVPETATSSGYLTESVPDTKIKREKESIGPLVDHLAFNGFMNIPEHESIPLYVDKTGGDPGTLPGHDKIMLFPNKDTCYSLEEKNAYKWFKQRNIRNSLTVAQDKVWGVGYGIPFRWPPMFCHKNDPQEEECDWSAITPEELLPKQDIKFAFDIHELYPNGGREEFSMDEIRLNKRSKYGRTSTRRRDLKESVVLRTENRNREHISIFIDEPASLAASHTKELAPLVMVQKSTIEPVAARRNIPVHIFADSEPYLAPTHSYKNEPIPIYQDENSSLGATTLNSKPIPIFQDENVPMGVTALNKNGLNSIFQDENKPIIKNEPVTIFRDEVMSITTTSSHRKDAPLSNIQSRDPPMFKLLKKDETDHNEQPALKEIQSSCQRETQIINSRTGTIPKTNRYQNRMNDEEMKENGAPNASTAHSIFRPKVSRELDSPQMSPNTCKSDGWKKPKVSDDFKLLNDTCTTQAFNFCIKQEFVSTPKAQKNCALAMRSSDEDSSIVSDDLEKQEPVLNKFQIYIDESRVAPTITPRETQNKMTLHQQGASLSRSTEIAGTFDDKASTEVYQDQEGRAIASRLSTSAPPSQFSSAASSCRSTYDLNISIPLNDYEKKTFFRKRSGRCSNDNKTTNMIGIDLSTYDLVERQLGAEPEEHRVVKSQEEHPPSEEDYDNDEKFGRSIYVAQNDLEYVEKEEAEWDEVTKMDVTQGKNEYMHQTVNLDETVQYIGAQILNAKDLNPFCSKFQTALLDHMGFLDRVAEMGSNVCEMVNIVHPIKPKKTVSIGKREFNILKIIGKGNFGSVFR